MTTRLRIVLPGGSGQVGSILSRHFHALGHDVVVLARRVTPAPWRVVNWDGESLGNQPNASMNDWNSVTAGTKSRRTFSRVKTKFHTRRTVIRIVPTSATNAAVLSVMVGV
jgi:nucleoside-diphosphate-sugar epimerase